jgi:2-C-methyl-D-erythritol 4-phosphate cytidylyltransferase
MDEAQHFWVVIPAAGIGQRFGNKAPKQYLRLFDKTILEHSIELFVDLPHIKQIIIPLSEDDDYFFNLPYYQHEKIQVVKGENIRSGSVLNALLYLKEKADGQDWVLVHDAVRPCLHPHDRQTLFQSLCQDPIGGILATPVADTVKHVTQQEISHTVNRASLWLAQTPQMFRLQVLLEALSFCAKSQLTVTDEASAIEQFGFSPKIVEAYYPNPKLTYPRDLDMITALILAKQEKETVV